MIHKVEFGPRAPKRRTPTSREALSETYRRMMILSLAAAGIFAMWPHEPDGIVQTTVRDTKELISKCITEVLK